MARPDPARSEAMKRKLAPELRDELVQHLQDRFEKNLPRHKGLKWPDVVARLDAQPEKVWSLHRMESTGGEPDVIGFDKKTGEFLFCDCAPETPKGRRSLCYDREALDARKEHKPANSALDLAGEMGVELLTEDDYQGLQKLGRFDMKTSSWLKTPPEMRKLGGALFGDFRFGRVFFYHNGAESYYGARGFRGLLRV